jgi:hypothetical protein
MCSMCQGVLHVSLCIAITSLLRPLHAPLFKFCIRRRLLSCLSPMRLLVVRRVGRVLAYRACSFRVVIGCRRFACGSCFACWLLRGRDNLIVEADSSIASVALVSASAFALSSSLARSSSSFLICCSADNFSAVFYSKSVGSSKRDNVGR